jgi:hypothetical protein
VTVNSFVVMSLLGAGDVTVGVVGGVASTVNVTLAEAVLP